MFDFTNIKKLLMGMHAPDLAGAKTGTTALKDFGIGAPMSAPPNALERIRQGIAKSAMQPELNNSVPGGSVMPDPSKLKQPRAAEYGVDYRTARDTAMKDGLSPDELTALRGDYQDTYGKRGFSNFFRNLLAGAGAAAQTGDPGAMLGGAIAGGAGSLIAPRATAGAVYDLQEVPRMLGENQTGFDLRSLAEKLQGMVADNRRKSAEAKRSEMGIGFDQGRFDSEIATEKVRREGYELDQAHKLRIYPSEEARAAAQAREAEVQAMKRGGLMDAQTAAAQASANQRNTGAGVNRARENEVRTMTPLRAENMQARTESTVSRNTRQNDQGYSQQEARDAQTLLEKLDTEINSTRAYAEDGKTTRPETAQEYSDRMARIQQMADNLRNAYGHVVEELPSTDERVPRFRLKPRRVAQSSGGMLRTTDDISHKYGLD